MLEILQLNSVFGGKSGNIKQMQDLILELQKKPALQNDLINLMENPEVVKLLSNPDMLTLLERLDPEFVKKLPKEFEEMRIYGFI
jgi:hypothetical protein